MSKTKPIQPRTPLNKTDLPEGWADPLVRDVLDVKYGKGLPEKSRKNGPYPVYGSNGVVGHHEEPLTAGPTIILGRKGTVGAVHYSRQPCWPIDTTYFIEEVTWLDMGFLYYALSTLGLSEMDTSSAIPGLNREDVFAQVLPLAPLPEQKRIVAKVGSLLERVNAARTRLARLPAILKRFRQSVLAAACSGQLTAEWREGNDAEPADHLLRALHARARAVLGKKYHEPACPQAEEEFELPSGWAFVGIESLLSIERRGMKTGPFGTALKKSEHQVDGVPVLGIENIGPMRFAPGSKIHITTEKAAELAEYDAQPDDILISRSGTVGEVCVVPKGLGEARISTNIMRVCLAKDSMLPQLFCFIFNGSPFVLSQVARLCGGSTRDFLNQAILRSIRFPLPPLSEQREIVRRVEALFTLADGIEALVRAATVRAERLPQAILARAFRGELVPTEGELATKEGREYEAASVLLERIQEARKQNKPAKRGSGGKNMAKRSTGRQAARNRKPLDEVLREQGKPLTPERLFDLAGFDENSVDGFYEQLRKLIRDGKIRENRLNKKDVTLEAVGT
jgi:type I restriction enzyme S subunit